MVGLSAIIALCSLSIEGKQNQQQDKHHEDRVFLSSELLAIADGKSFGIHADYIGFMLQIVRELNKMVDGERNNKGTPRGIFMFENTLYTLQELRSIETDLETEFQKINLEQKSPSKKQKLDSLTAKKNALKTALNDAIKHFATKILPFNDHARGVQKLISALIEESCTKRNRTDSFMFTWGVCPEGQELEFLTKNMASFKLFELFIGDLVNFLKDVIYSCPKARADFLAMIKQKMEHADGHQEPGSPS
jgi:hypothetical protein